MSKLRFFLGISAALCFAVPVCQADWLRFRGPNGSGLSADIQSTPTKWSPKENLRWKVELPGPGVSSPIVVGNRVFVTCYSGYGLSRENPGDINQLKRHLVCVDANTGKIQWEKTVDAVLPEDPYSGIGVTAHGYASHTPTSDGENVYVFFGKTGVLAFDLEGNEIWRTSVGTGSDDRQWGSSSSPILSDGLLIVTASAESRALVGLDKKTGKEVWREEADGLSNVWGTPILVKVDPSRTDLVLGVPYDFWGLNPETGKLRWYSGAMDTDQYSSSVVESSGVIYGIEGRGGGSAAIKAGGNGDVTETNTVWNGDDSARFGSPLVFDGRIYSFSNGVANCINAEDGTSIFKGRLPGASGNGGGGDQGGRRGAGGQNGGGPSQPPGQQRPQGGFGGGQGGFGGGQGGFGAGQGGFGGGQRGGGGFGGFGAMDYASAVAADGKIYYLQGDGTMHVIQSGDEFELLASNKVTDDSESFGGTPAISGGKIFLRSDKHLYCVSQEE